MANPTSAFGWQMPTNTDLVKDLPADFEVFGQAVDTDLADLKGGTTGQVLSKTSNTDMDFTWVTPNVGDITEVQAGTGISVASGTGPIPVVTSTVATTFDAAGDVLVGTGSDTWKRLGIGTAGQVLTVNSGANDLEWAAAAGGVTFVGCSLTRNGTNFSIANNSTTTVDWDSELYDSDGFHSNVTNPSRITIPAGKDGYYWIYFKGEMAANTTGERSFYIYVNGVLKSYYTFGGTLANLDMTGQVSMIYDLAVGDYLTAGIYQNSGGALNMTGTQTYRSMFMAYKIGD